MGLRASIFGREAMSSLECEEDKVEGADGGLLRALDGVGDWRLWAPTGEVR